MGSFNVACSISHISINDGMKCCFIPLIKAEYEHFSSMLCYPSDMFSPYSLPIFGEYNDYGLLTNITRDANVNALEKYLELPIEDIIEGIIRSSGKMEDKNLRGMYVLTDIYKQMALNRKNFEENYDEQFRDLYANKAGLYYDNYVSPKENTKETLLLLDMKQNPQNYETNAYDKLIEKVREQFKKRISAIGERDFRNYFSEIPQRHLYDLYGETIEAGLMRDDYIEWALFYTYMSSANRAFTPTCNGEQCGNLEVEREMVEMINKIVTQKEKEYEEY